MQLKHSSNHCKYMYNFLSNEKKIGPRDLCSLALEEIVQRQVGVGWVGVNRGRGG